jgi:hypothetical protein
MRDAVARLSMRCDRQVIVSPQLTRDREGVGGVRIQVNFVKKFYENQYLP